MRDELVEIWIYVALKVDSYSGPLFAESRSVICKPGNSSRWYIRINHSN